MGVYPYQYNNFTSKLREDKFLSIESFYDWLRDHQCTTADYGFPKRAWAKGGCKMVRIIVK